VPLLLADAVEKRIAQDGEEPGFVRGDIGGLVIGAERLDHTILDQIASLLGIAAEHIGIFQQRLESGLNFPAAD